jgi:hypothetical protein
MNLGKNVGTINPTLMELRKDSMNPMHHYKQLEPKEHIVNPVYRYFIRDKGNQTMGKTGNYIYSSKANEIDDSFNIPSKPSRANNPNGSMFAIPTRTKITLNNGVIVTGIFDDYNDVYWVKGTYTIQHPDGRKESHFHDKSREPLGLLKSDIIDIRAANHDGGKSRRRRRRKCRRSRRF